MACEKQSQFHIRIDSTLLEWFRSHCRENDVNMSDFIRKHLEKVRRREARKKREAQLARHTDVHQLRLFD